MSYKIDKEILLNFLETLEKLKLDDKHSLFEHLDELNRQIIKIKGNLPWYIDEE